MRALIFISLMALSYLTSLSFAFGEEMNWTDKVKMGMDFRYRHEMVDDKTKDFDQHRQRMRARFSVVGEVDENLKLHLRLATGETGSAYTNFSDKTRTSGNETFDDAGANDPFWVDLAFAEWKVTESNTINLGKVNQPFYVAQKSQLIWDGDWTPEGLSYNYSCKCDSVSYLANFGAFWLSEGNSTNDTSDKGLIGGQIGAEFSMGEPSLKLAVGNYVFANIKDSDVISSANGNTTYTDPASSTVYKYDYNLIEGTVELKAAVAEMPSSVYVNYVQNSDPSDDNTGYIAGFGIGKVKNVGDWSFGYNYRKVEKDAVIASLQDSDFIVLAD